MNALPRILSTKGTDPLHHIHPDDFNSQEVMQIPVYSDREGASSRSRATQIPPTAPPW